MMARRSNEPDPDDWFAEAAPLPRRNRPPQTSVPDETTLPEPRPPEDWFHDENASAQRLRKRLGGDWRPDPRRTVAIAAATIVILIIGLAAAGVFSASSPHRAPPKPTTAGRRASPPATTIAQPPTVTLKPGDRGIQVLRLQRALASLGGSPGKTDGQYGAATTKAVARFQQANNLTSDGVFGPKTLAALKRALQHAGCGEPGQPDCLLNRVRRRRRPSIAANPSRLCPAPMATHVSGEGATVTARSVSARKSSSRRLRSAPPPSKTNPRVPRSAASSGGVRSSVSLTASTICPSGRRNASCTSSADSVTRRNKPVIRSRPATSASSAAK